MPVSPISWLIQRRELISGRTAGSSTMPEPEPLLNLRGDLTGFALFLIAGYLRVLLKVVLTSHI
jgi:hypothetical protein